MKTSEFMELVTGEKMPAYQKKVFDIIDEIGPEEAKRRMVSGPARLRQAARIQARQWFATMRELFPSEPAG